MQQDLTAARRSELPCREASAISRRATSFRYGLGYPMVEPRIQLLAKNISQPWKRKNWSTFWSRVRHSTSTRSGAIASFPNLKFKLQYLPDFFSGSLDPWFQSILEHSNNECLKFQGVRLKGEVLPMNLLYRPKAEVDRSVLVFHGGEFC